MITRHMREAIPIRVVAIHHFINSYLLEYLVPMLMVLFGPAIRKRYVPHMGCEEKFLDELAEYGIDRNILPVHMGGKSDFCYSQWLEDRRSRGL